MVKIAMDQKQADLIPKPLPFARFHLLCMLIEESDLLTLELKLQDMMHEVAPRERVHCTHSFDLVHIIIIISSLGHWPKIRA